VSHTWPDRWTTPGIKDSIIVYSNCDEVELFNDVNAQSLGKQTRNGIGTHFQWNKADIKYNVLYAVGYVNGKKVATDYIVLHHLSQAPHFSKFYQRLQPSAGTKIGGGTAQLPPHRGGQGGPGGLYLYRVNCGGPAYTDANGNLWLADREKKSNDTWGCISWTAQFPGMPANYASQRYTNDPIAGTADWPLYQTFRYGLQQLRYEFPVPDGDYQVELYFIEPWWGTGGGMNCTGWRLFDVAVNNKTVIKNLDIWKEAGHDRLLKKTVSVHVTGGQLQISFPHIAAGQAIISAIAIATSNTKAVAAPGSPLLINNVPVTNAVITQVTAKTWLNTGDQPYSSNSHAAFSVLPPALYGAEWIQWPHNYTLSSNDSLIGAFKVTASNRSC
jgi:hypothetical protein